MKEGSFLMKRIAVMGLVLCLAAAGTLADAIPMTRYTAGEMIDVGFNGNVQFMAGCEFDDGSTIMLVDTDFADGYLLIDPDSFYYDSIGSGIPIEKEWDAQVTAQDIEHCTVTLSSGKQTLRYHFSFVPVAYEYEQVWMLDRLENTDGDMRFTADFSFWRADMTQTQNGKTETAAVYYQFFREANNLNFDKLPKSIEEGKRLESKYPVAAVSPDDPTTRVNLREGPGTDYPRCGSLYSGTLLAVREMKDGWAKIFVGDTDAYISTEFLAFSAEIESVSDMRPTAMLRDGEWIEVSRAPYRGGGGTVTRTRGGQTVRIMGEYNNQWRIVSTDPGSYYVHVNDLQ